MLPIRTNASRASRWARRLAGDMAGRDRFAVLLEAQVQAACDGIDALIDAGREQSPPPAHRLAAIEARGDAVRRELVAELSQALVTPIDREDLFRVSRSLDDVLDNLHDLSRELDLYVVRLEPHIEGLLRQVRCGLEILMGAVDLASTDQNRSQLLEVKGAANLVRREYQKALAHLFSQELTMDVIKQREVLRRLDVVGLRLGEAADALADGLVKRHI